MKQGHRPQHALPHEEPRSVVVLRHAETRPNCADDSVDIKIGFSIGGDQYIDRREDQKAAENSTAVPSRHGAA